MTVSERAGKPADPSQLVDVDQLLAAYQDRPDPSDPAQRVAFGTSGHRGSSLRRSFNEAHIVATTEAICRYRKAQSTDGPLFVARDTHALSEPAFRTAVEVLVANGVGVKPSRLSIMTSTPLATSTSTAVLKAGSDRAWVSRATNSGPSVLWALR